nr:ribonuclease H [Ipomoea batatas]
MKAKEGTRTQPESLEPYGPWMIVKRPPRRQVSTHGKKQGVKNGMSGYHNDNNFGDKNNQSKASGSRFAVLEDEILNGENFNVNMMEDQTENSECSPVRGSCLNEKAKGKRPTVQVSAKQILGLNGSQPLRPMVEQNNEQQRRSAGYSRRETGGHKAAAAEEHIVVRGENHGAHIVTTTVRHIDNTTLTRNNAEDMMEEHHSDPPRMGNSVEAEVVMEEALPQDLENDDKVAWILDQYNTTTRAFYKEIKRGDIINRGNNEILRWERPKNNTIAIDVDGSINVTTKVAGCGGIARNQEGSWQGGFMFKTSLARIAEIEAVAVLKAMEWAWSKGFRNIEIRSDSREIVKRLNGEQMTRGLLNNIIETCKRWMAKDWEVTIKHVYREQNHIADNLAKLACQREDRWSCLREPPAVILRNIEEDALGIPSVRCGVRVY